MKQALLRHVSRIPQIKKYYSGIGIIFTLHRVTALDTNKLFPNENMKVSPEFLISFINELKLKGYSFISLNRLHEILLNNEKLDKQIVFTIDDGYRDNYEIAYPIFKEFKIPFTIYLTSSFPQQNAILWWYELEDLIIRNDQVNLFDGMYFSCDTLNRKLESFLKIRELIMNLDQKNLFDELNKLFNNYKIDWFKKCSELAMNWQQIIELSKDELVQIEGHSKNHYAFNKLKDIEILKEIKESNELIEQHIGCKVKHFAYPYGGREEVGKREIDILSSLSINTGVTTRHGTIYNDHRNYLECLPRIMLTEGLKIEDCAKVRKNKVVSL